MTEPLDHWGLQKDDNPGGHIYTGSVWLILDYDSGQGFRGLVFETAETSDTELNSRRFSKSMVLERPTPTKQE